ncbi:MAG: hypothetical protein ABI614_21225 [Planctomycetota bacterium]
MQQQLQLLAEYSDGSIRDVTRLEFYKVNTTRIAQVTDRQRFDPIANVPLPVCCVALSADGPRLSLRSKSGQVQV